MPDEITEEFRNAVHTLQGMSCTDVRGGFGVGSMMWLMFGELHSIPIKLKEHEFTLNESDNGLDIHMATWRIQNAGGVICTSSSDNRIDGPIDEGMKFMRGRKVEQVILEPMTYDLHLKFEGQLELLIFCTQRGQPHQYDNYAVRCNKRHFTVGANSKLRVELT